MIGFEQFMGTENLSETVGASREFVGMTEVCNFEGCQLINNKELTSYLSETLPPSHLEGCPRIVFDPNHVEFAKSPCTLGFFECGSHAIHIGAEGRFPDGREGILDTVTHEVGHNAYAQILQSNQTLSWQWDALHTDSFHLMNTENRGFVSEYATTNKFEDFAESYKTYIRDPELLKVMSPEKYQFMRDYVFSGRQYNPNIFAYWTYDSSSNKIEVTGNGVFDLSGNKIANSL